MSIENNFKIRDKMYREFLDRTYRELLLRSVDSEGLEYFLTLLKNQEMTMVDVRNSILKSEECMRIRSFSHYADQYWNGLEAVIQYKNRLATGNSDKIWQEDIIDRFKEHIPFENVLIVGCGNGWVERQLYDLGIGLHFDAFDIAEEYLDTAIKEKGDRPIRYFVSDINKMDNIQDEKYDAVFNYAILHHAKNIEFAIEKLAKVLKPGGMIFNEEYVGPARNQYSDEHLKIMHEIMSRLPERLRSKYLLRPPLENFRVEPSEAIHSDMIRPLFKKYFDIIYERDLNGGIAYQILWNNIEGFKNPSDKEAMDSLKNLLDADYNLSKAKKVPVLFWYGVGRPKK